MDSTISLLEDIRAELEEKLKPGEKMVFGQVRSVSKGGKMDPKAAWKKKRQHQRKRAAKRSKKGYSREVQRQVQHHKARGVKKKRGMKETLERLSALLVRPA